MLRSVLLLTTLVTSVTAGRYISHVETSDPKKLSEMSGDELKQIMSVDETMYMQVQKDMILLAEIQRHSPDFYKEKFKEEDRTSSEIAGGAFSAGMTLLTVGLHDVHGWAKDVWEIGHKVFDHVHLAYEVKEAMALQFVAYVTMLTKLGSKAPTAYLPDVTLGHLQDALKEASMAVNNAYKAKNQHWYEHLGFSRRIWDLSSEPPAMVGHLKEHEVVILDKFIIHGWSGPPVPLDPFEDDFGTSFPSKATVSNFARLGDGRGYVQYPPDKGGNILNFRRLDASSKNKACNEVRSKIEASEELPSSALEDKVRSATQSVAEVTHSSAWGVGKALVNAVMIGIGIGFPPSIPALAVIAPAVNLVSTAVKTGSGVGFEKLIEPILKYLFIGLVNMEMEIFNPDIRPSSDCNYDPSMVKQFQTYFNHTFGRVRCDIIDQPCADGMFCMRDGLFTRVSGKANSFGFCMPAPWKQVANGFVCTQDRDCKRGLCNRFTSQLPDVDLVEEGESPEAQTLKRKVQLLFGTTQLSGLPKETKALLGVCVQPCRVGAASKGNCEIVRSGAGYGYMPETARLVDWVDE